MQESLPIYFMTAQDYRQLEDTVAQLAGILDRAFETMALDIEPDEGSSLT
jgi:hypothetical protein